MLVGLRHRVVLGDHYRRDPAGQPSGPERDQIGVAHRRDQHSGAFASEILGQRPEAPQQPASSQIHHSHRRWKAAQEDAVRFRQHQIHRIAPVSDAFDQIHHHPLRASAADRRQKEGDTPIPAHAGFRMRKGRSSAT